MLQFFRDIQDGIITVISSIDYRSISNNTDKEIQAHTFSLKS
jgi:hypothetical protein